MHDLYGLSDWVRSFADAFAAEGFVAVAPDLLKGMAPGGGDVPGTTEAMAAAGRSYEAIVYEGATVFLKAQEGLAANRRATEDAWPRTLAFLREHLGS